MQNTLIKKKTIKIVIFIILISIFGVATYKYFFKSWAPYYQKRLSQEPRPLLVEALKMYKENASAEKKVLELGAGSGNDTAWLLKNGWTVWANDREIESIKIISQRKDVDSYKERLHLIHADFLNLAWSELPQFDLIYASYALPFLDKNNFHIVWNHIIAQLKVDGILAVNFFDQRHQGFNAWEKRSMTFFTEEEIVDLFKGFKIEFFEESDDYSFDVIVRKIVE
jgi:tellurite methyltransferase